MYLCVCVLFFNAEQNCHRWESALRLHTCILARTQILGWSKYSDYSCPVKSLSSAECCSLFGYIVSRDCCEMRSSVLLGIGRQKHTDVSPTSKNYKVRKWHILTTNSFTSLTHRQPVTLNKGFIFLPLDVNELHRLRILLSLSQLHLLLCARTTNTHIHL